MNAWWIEKWWILSNNQSFKTAMHHDLVEKALKQSLDDLNLAYIDLYLIHVPFAVPESGVAHDANGNIILDVTTDHVAIWKVGLAHIHPICIRIGT